MTIDPRWGVWFSILLAVLAFLGTAQDTLSVLVGPNSTKVVMAVITLILGVGNAVNAVLHAIPAQVPSTPQAAKAFYLGPEPDTSYVHGGGGGQHIGH